MTPNAFKMHLKSIQTNIFPKKDSHVREKREKTVDMKMDTHLVPLIPGVTGVLG
jgi:hypothetical protein